jgi:AcrR family transcriptional regulator
MRRDAQTRRKALIQAAAECFFRSGYLVPMEEIAERAGVGRGTLYRNFRDRMALAIAIFDREVSRMEEQLDTSLPLEKAMTALVMDGAQGSALYSRLAADMPFDAEHRAAFDKLGERYVRLVQPVVEKAHGEGVLRPDIGARELLLVLRMLTGLLKPHLSPVEAQALVAKAMPLLMTGLRPR